MINFYRKIRKKLADENEFQAVYTAPVWSKNANIYEVNIRQYTDEGTINAFREHLPRLLKTACVNGDKGASRRQSATVSLFDAEGTNAP